MIGILDAQLLLVDAVNFLFDITVANQFSPKGLWTLVLKTLNLSALILHVHKNIWIFFNSCKVAQTSLC